MLERLHPDTLEEIDDLIYMIKKAIADIDFLIWLEEKEKMLDKPKPDA